MYDVVIPSLANETTKPYLKLCVESLRQSGVDGKIIVITNGGFKPILNDIKGITTHLHTRDQGQCNATNIGTQLATADYLMVSNDDMYYSPDWKKNLEFKHLVFSPNLVEPTNNLGSAAPFLKFAGGYTLDEFNKAMVDGFIGRQTDIIQEDESGFNLPFLIKKDFWDFL